MPDRPFADKRPFGPFIGRDSNKGDTNVDIDDSDKGNIPNGDTNIDDPILEQAESWYNNITKDGTKRKMMENYLLSITNLSREEINDRLDKAGI